MQPLMKKILIFYDYFYPAYKAGGPIQSIANLCRTFKNEFDFYIICKDQDYGETSPLSSIQSNCWNDFENQTAKVYYISRSFPKRYIIGHLIREVKPDTIMVNGLFSPVFSIIPLLIGKSKKIVSVRGMLHPGALTQKALKKKLFVFFLKKFRITKNVIFHATNDEEVKHIKKIFGDKIKITDGIDIPAVQEVGNEGSLRHSSIKQAGKIKLVTVALISPMKNHALILLALQKVSAYVHYDIYGPIKDKDYWNECLQIINTLPSNIVVNYKGSLHPTKVSSVLVQNQCFIMPSKSENFSHSIYESLSSGIPVITSFFTPWNHLKQNKAGWNVDITDLQTITSAIETIASFDEKEYAQWSRSSIAFAKKSIDIDKIKIQYRSLLNL
jgi:glycosyltransferase involved in cell wall biosynthesis